MPGIEATGTRVFFPATTNSGQIKSSAVSTFSRTMRRAHSDLRLRRIRVVRSSDVVCAGASTRCGQAPASIGRPYLMAMVGSPDGAFLLAPARPHQRSGSAFHRDLGLQALLVAEDRGDRQRLAAAAVAQHAVLAGDVALDREVVPLLGM